MVGREQYVVEESDAKSAAASRTYVDRLLEMIGNFSAGASTLSMRPPCRPKTYPRLLVWKLGLLKNRGLY